MRAVGRDTEWRPNSTGSERDVGHFRLPYRHRKCPKLRSKPVDARRFAENGFLLVTYIDVTCSMHCYWDYCRESAKLLTQLQPISTSWLDVMSRAWRSSVRPSVRLSVRSHNSKTTRPIFTKFVFALMPVAMARLSSDGVAIRYQNAAPRGAVC